jgi:hypothetical protein
MKRKLIECPRCGEADERSAGTNRCGLCECEFRVTWWAAMGVPKTKEEGDELMDNGRNTGGKSYYRP